MNKVNYQIANKVIQTALASCLPDVGVKKALASFVKPKGKVIMIALGKAANLMARSCLESIEVEKGIVINKFPNDYDWPTNITYIQAGHPLLNENSILAGEKAWELTDNLTQDDVVIFLLSGGGSALFELPVLPLKQMQAINQQLLKCGANIQQINTIRKRLSRVKGGRFALHCAPAKVINIILSDIIQDDLDMVASGPCVVDQSTYQQAKEIINEYHLDISSEALRKESVDQLDNVTISLVGNNSMMLQAVKSMAITLGYNTISLDKPLIEDIDLCKQKLLKLYNQAPNHSAIIAGGEVTVQVKGNGIGGRNQHLALSLLPYLKASDFAICLASDGNDSTSLASGGYVDGSMHLDNVDYYLANFDSYHGLEKINGIIPPMITNTNVCDLYAIFKN